MGMVVFGPIGREVTGAMYILAYVLVAGPYISTGFCIPLSRLLFTGNGILGSAISLNAVSDHATCT